MDYMKMPLFSGVLAMLALLVIQVQAQGGTITYCSSQNTGSDNGPKFHTWQSNGWCTGQCKGEYAFAIVQNLDCWCSNYVPEDQADTGNCDKPCPGFPDEKCGSKDGKLFGYIRLGKQPSGTQELPKPTSSAALPPKEGPPTVVPIPSPAPPSPVPSHEDTHRDPETIVQTVTESAVVLTYTPSEKPSSPPPTTFATSATKEEPAPSIEPAPSNKPATSILVVTVGGNPVTHTIVYSSSATPPAANPQKKGTSTGAIVGGVLGGIAGLAAVVGGIFFLLWRRRRRQQDEDDHSGVHRNTSTMSKAGLIRTEKAPQYPPKLATNIRRNSRMMGDGDSISPVSGSDRRNSRPYLFDQRLNPSAIMNMDNASRGSFVSMDDSRDYGRTLNVRNPDPDPQ